MNTLIISRLRELKPILFEKYGIEEFAVFGSIAKGTDSERSDIDIAILKMQIKDGFDIVRAQKYLEDVFGRKVDIGTFKAMKTFIRNRIQKDFIYV
jgi:predicted nucleotidyltransferase